MDIKGKKAILYDLKNNAVASAVIQQNDSFYMSNAEGLSLKFNRFNHDAFNVLDLNSNRPICVIRGNSNRYNLTDNNIHLGYLRIL